MSVSPATIKDVARVAGVSVATVSRALNGAENVLPDTRQRILDIARDLRYAPSGAARSLITRKTDTVGALLPDLHGEFFSELIRGIDQAARARGLHLLLSSSHDDADEAAAALRAMNGRVDGLIVMSPHADDDFLSRNLPPNLPAVLLNSGVRRPTQRVFAVDNFGGARAMTEHLVAQGAAASPSWVVRPATSRPVSASAATAPACLATLNPGCWQATSPKKAASGLLRCCWRCRRPSGRMRCLRPTTSWPSACWARCLPLACRCRGTWPWPASTTSPSRAT